MVAWYKHDIPAWMDGTEDLDDGPYRIYHVVCQLIYLNEGPIALNERGIAGRCCQRIDRFRVHLKVLIDLGKLSIVNGKLFNDRCSAELSQIETNRANAGKGGRAARRKLSDSSQIAHSMVSDTSPIHQRHLSDSSMDGLSSYSDDKSLKDNGEYVAELQNEPSLRLEKTREENKEHCRVSKETPTRQIYSEDFETNFWKPFPRTAIMSKKEAWREWMKLEPDQREAACRAVPAYDAHLKKNPTLHAVHACRFLSQNRAEGILEIAAEKPKFDVRAHIA